jgi:hypothetical protein
MIEFLTNYGLWIVLAGVFFAMHRFGMGCCGGGHRHGPVERPQGVSGGPPQTEKASEEGRSSGAGCH